MTLCACFFFTLVYLVVCQGFFFFFFFVEKCSDFLLGCATQVE